jgi:hypothetical protein
MGVRQPAMMTTSLEPAMDALLPTIRLSEITLHYRSGRRSGRVHEIHSGDVWRDADETGMCARHRARKGGGMSLRRLVHDFFLLRAARDDFGASFGASVMIIFLLTSMSDDSIQSTQLQQKTAANFHEEWKGRIDPWQPKRKRRRKQRSTKNCSKGNDGDAMSVPKVFCGHR